MGLHGVAPNKNVSDIFRKAQKTILGMFAEHMLRTVCFMFCGSTKQWSEHAGHQRNVAFSSDRESSFAPSVFPKPASDTLHMG